MATAVFESALVENLVQFVREDLTAMQKERDWWQPRIEVICTWIKCEERIVKLPKDGAENLIVQQLQRGAIYPASRMKCWKHILLELQDIPWISHETEKISSLLTCDIKSPSRGKLRAGKDLITPLSALSNQEASVNEEQLYRDQFDVSASIANKPLTMLERQVQWLNRKNEKVESERARQEKLKYEDVTFKPKLIRRSTSGVDNHKPALKHGGSVRSLIEKTPEDKPSQPRRRPATSGTKRMGREHPKLSLRAMETKLAYSKKKKPGSTSQHLVIKSSLLDRMKLELAASQSPDLRVEERSQQYFDKEIIDEAACTDEQSENEPVIRQMSPTSFIPEVINDSTWDADAIIEGHKVKFDCSGTKARILLQDVSLFDLSSMYRKTDRKARREGIALQMGRRDDNYQEKVIAVLFDMDKVRQQEAVQWWKENAHRFLEEEAFHPTRAF